MLNGTLQLHDIRDVEALCKHILRRNNHNPDDEDTLAYLIETCWELSLRYTPRPNNSFSTWATTTLTRRLTDHTRKRNGRTTWKFHNRTYTRTIPTTISLDNPREPTPETGRHPATDRDPDHLTRLLRSRSSSEAWDHDRNRTPLQKRAA